MKKLLSKIVVTVLVCVLTILAVTSVSAATTTASVTNKAGKVVATFPVDTASANGGLQDALDFIRDNASDKNILRLCLPKGAYAITGTLNIYSNTILDLTGVTLNRTGGGSAIRFGRGNEISSGYNGYKNITITGSADSYGVIDGGNGTTTPLRFAHANNINISYMTFTNVKWSHHVEFAGCNNVTFYSCTFNGFNPAGKEDSNNHEAIQMDILTAGHFPNYDNYDNTVNKNISITNCLFENLNRGVGVHSGVVGQYMENILISGNTFKNISGYAVVATNYRNSEISNNTIVDCGAGIHFRHITLNNVNYYGGSASAVNKNMNCVIKNNTISLKSTAFSDSRYGIRVYGRVVSKAVKANGGTIPKADYRVSGLTISGNTITTSVYANGIWLQGVLKSTVSGNSIAFNIAKKAKDSCDGIKLEDTESITLSGNTIAEQGKTRLARSGMYLRNALKTTISKNTVTNMNQDGIYLDNCDGSKVEKNTIDGVRKHGIYVDGGSGTSKTYISVSGNTIKNVGSRGINVNAKSYANITSNTITKTGEHGICITKSAVSKNVKNNKITNAGDMGIYVSDKATASTVSGNTITTPKGHGIYLRSKAVTSSIKKNTIVDAGDCGIRVLSSKAGTVSGNTIKKNKNKVSSVNGIFLSGNSSATALSSNKISDTKGHSLYLSDTASATKIEKNTIKNAGEHGMYLKSKVKVTTLSSNTITKVKVNGIYLKDTASVKTLSKNTISDCGKIGLNVDKKAKTTASANKVSDCDECEIRLMGSTNKKINGSKFAIKTVKKNGKSISVTWNSLKNVQKYEISRSTSKNGTYKKIGTVSGTTFQDKSVKSGKTYYYKVTPIATYSSSTVKLVASSAKSLKFK